MEKDVFSSDRPFRVWDYLVSHDQLLLRSPKIKGYKKNIDIVFFGVTYIQLHTVLSGVNIREICPSDSEVDDSIKQHLSHESNKLFEVLSSNERYLIIAAFVRVFENDLEFRESSLGFTELGRENEILDC